MDNHFNIRLEGTTLYVNLGRELTADNAPLLQQELKGYQGRYITKIVYDATGLVYISSSGVRVITYAFQKIGRLPTIEFVNCAQEIHDTLDMVGITSIINFVADEARKGGTGVRDARLKEKLSALNQQQLDNFAANNDVVVYNMKLGHEED